MKLTIILFIGWKNLKVNKARSVLTIGGVALGIGIVTFLICLGFGMQKMIINEVTKDNPINILDINNGNLDNFVSLNDENMEKIKKIEGVSAAERQANTGAKVSFQGSQTDVVVYGANIEYLEMARIFYRKGEINFENNEGRVIISSRLAQLLGFSEARESIGKKINYDLVITKEVSSQLQEERLETNLEADIVGLIEDNENIFFILPFNYMREKFGVDSAQKGKISIINEESSDEVKIRVQQLGFATESIADVIKDINDFFVIIRIIMVVLGSIIMSISAMGMINTLSVSLLQRTKEVGILKALGAKRADIFKIFIFEAVIISFTGGIIGFLSGYGLAFLLNEFFIFYSAKQGIELGSFVHVPYYFLIAIGSFIFFLAFATGIMPAQRASKIHALDALRYE